MAGSPAAALLEAMHAAGVPETSTPLWREVLQQVEDLVVRWVQQVGVAEGLSEEQAADAGAKLLQLGSYALDALMPGADMDLAAAVPYFVERRHFFEDGGLSGLLRACEDVTELRQVPSAFVPVIKFDLRGVPIDLLLVRLKLPQIPPSLTAMSEGLLAKCIEEVDVHSLNGARVAAALPRLVPSVPNFRATLRGVKLWALRRGINNFAQGFPGGVAWALLTAKVCQLNPTAEPSVLLDRFFMTWRLWKFGASPATPVLLTGAEKLSTDELPPKLAAHDWNPARNPRDRAYLMPVITPCRPRLCATHSITRSTLGVVRAELERAAALTHALLRPGIPLEPAPAAGAAAPPPAAAAAAAAASASSSGVAPSVAGWAALYGELFSQSRFFAAYRGFVAVSLAADTPVELLHWKGYVGSRLRKLLLLLERVDRLGAAHPLPTPFAVPPAHEPPPLAPPHRLCFFIGVRLVAGRSNASHVDLRAAAEEWVEQVCAWEDFADLCPTAQLHVRYTKRAELPDALPDELRQPPPAPSADAPPAPGGAADGSAAPTAKGRKRPVPADQQGAPRAPKKAAA